MGARPGHAHSSTGGCGQHTQGRSRVPRQGDGQARDDQQVRNRISSAINIEISQVQFSTHLKILVPTVDTQRVGNDKKLQNK